MPFNPSTSKVTTARGAGMPNQDNLNNPVSYNSESYNTFDRSNLRLMTQRFSDIHPFNCQMPVDGDVVRVRNRFDLSSYTMKSRVLTDMSFHMDHFSVPFSSIIPNTWRYFIRQPLKGDDLPDKAKPYFRPLSVFSDILNNVLDSGLYDDVEFKVILGVYALSVFAGNDSLLKSLGYSFPKSIADAVDQLVTDYFTYLIDEGTTGVKNGIIIELNGEATSVVLETVSDLFNFINDYSRGFYPQGVSGVFAADGQTPIRFDARDILQNFWDSFSVLVDKFMPTLDSRTICTLPVLAYNQIVSQYYSNSHVDDIYSGEMFLSNLLALADQEGYLVSFEINGVPVLSDVGSRDVFEHLLSRSITDQNFEVFFNLFTFKASLRYGDYFASSRLSPLAVGDFSAAVNDNKVSVIDVNEKLWYQRLANAVNRSQQEIYSYLWSMFGVKPERIAPQPNFICSESFNINNLTVENTGDIQFTESNSVSSRMASNQSKFMYEIFVDEPCVIIGLSSFQARYVYPDAIDKVFDMQDRFDYFNPYLQHIGDQEVKTHELTASASLYDENFAYQLRYAQFKYGSLSHATGAFAAGLLPSWALIWNNYAFRLGASFDSKLTPSFIRNHDADIDPLYLSLTGSNPASRFHFIIAIWNDEIANSKQQAYPSLV